MWELFWKSGDFIWNDPLLSATENFSLAISSPLLSPLKKGKKKNFNYNKHYFKHIISLHNMLTS